MKRIHTALLTLLCVVSSFAADIIPQSDMQRIYQEVRTPYKYGMVVAPTDNYHKIDCPTVFQQDGKWYMTYVVYNGKDGLDGRGYETWLAKSDDLLHWETLGRVLSYKDDGWDMNQRGGFPALIDWTWDGSYELGEFKGKHWMTYIGGHGTGYEAVREPLNIGMAWTQDDITNAHEWQSGEKPLLSINDRDVQWWEKLVQYKSTIYSLTPSPSPKGEGSGLPKELKKYRFIMFYNAGGINPANDLKAERIGIALSNDLVPYRKHLVQIFLSIRSDQHGRFLLLILIFIGLCLQPGAFRLSGPGTDQYFPPSAKRICGGPAGIHRRLQKGAPGTMEAAITQDCGKSGCRGRIPLFPIFPQIHSQQGISTVYFITY